MYNFNEAFRKLKLLLEFYKSTFVYSLAFFGFFLTVQNVKFAFFFGSCIGLLIAFFVKEFNKNKTYLFYMNANLSKVKLYGFCILVNLIVSLIFLILGK